jgi:hypothetical protein
MIKNQILSQVKDCEKYFKARKINENFIIYEDDSADCKQTRIKKYAEIFLNSLR